MEQVLGNPILGHSGAERSRWRCTTTTVKALTELGAVLGVSPPVEGMTHDEGGTQELHPNVRSFWGPHKICDR